MKYAFIVTSAVNTRFGVYTPEQRLAQTEETVASIRKKIPNALVVIMEVTGTPLLPAQEARLKQSCDIFVDYTADQSVVDLYNATDNWDIVKNGTEIMCFGRVLAMLENEKLLDNIDRVYKMSGRYKLNDQFDSEYYEQPGVIDKIVIGTKTKSQFPVELTTQPWQYMARLWSWPKPLTNEVIGIYSKSLSFFAERLAAGGYVDIEHVLAKFLPVDKVIELEFTGVEGAIAPNGAIIKN